MSRNFYKKYAIVYGLIDPDTLLIRYIGKSVGGIQRAYHHLSPSSLKEGNTPKNNWIKKLLKQNKKYKVVILYSIKKDGKDLTTINEEIYKKEQEFINIHKTTLLNLTDGGPGAVGRVLSEESKKKMCISAKKRGAAHLQKYKFKNKTEEEKAATREKFKRLLKNRDRKVPGSRFKYAAKVGSKIIAVDKTGNEMVGFYSKRHAASMLGQKCSHTGITYAIKNKLFYYGYYWKEITCQ